MRIDQFRGKYKFLSNFYPCKVILDGVEYHSVENAYQAAKTLDEKERIRFQVLTAKQAKQAGKLLDIRDDWSYTRLIIMIDLVTQKFSNDHTLKQMLIDTGNAELIEGNEWKDTFWGVCEGKGSNHLGKILMGIRTKLQCKRDYRN